MKMLQRFFVAIGFVATLGILTALADYVIKDGNGSSQTVFAFVCFTTKVCPASVPINSAGTEIGTSAAPMEVNLRSSTVGVATAANQATEIASLATIASNTGAAIPTQAATVNIGAVGISQTTDGTTNAVRLLAETTKVIGTVNQGTSPWVVGTAAADPCQGNVASKVVISITTATTTNILTGTSAKKIYVCYLYLQTVAANNVAVISGTTGATCGANTAALIGGVTAANGLNNAANSGQALGNGGFWVTRTETNNDDICIITSAATPLAGVMKYVVQ